MTIEAERDKKKLFGLRNSIQTRVLEFRRWTKDEGSVSYSNRPSTVLLHEGNIFNIDREPPILAEPISEDEILVKLLGERDGLIYSREEINQAGLVTSSGERLKWRETKSGDYPPLEFDQVASPPIQLGLGLHKQIDA